SKLLGSLRSPGHVAALGRLRASVPVPLAQRLAIGPRAHALVVGRPHLLDSVSEAAQPGGKHAAGGLPPHDRRLRALVPGQHGLVYHGAGGRLLSGFVFRYRVRLEPALPDLGEARRSAISQHLRGRPDAHRVRRRPPGQADIGPGAILREPPGRLSTTQCLPFFSAFATLDRAMLSRRKKSSPPKNE